MQVGEVPPQMKPAIFLVNGTCANTATWLRTDLYWSPSQGRSVEYSCPKASFKKPANYKSNAKTRQLQKKLGTARTQTWTVSYLFWKSETAQTCMAKLQNLWTKIYNTTTTDSKKGQALLSFSISVPPRNTVINSYYKQCFTFVNGDISLAPRHQEEESEIQIHSITLEKQANEPI